MADDSLTVLRRAFVDICAGYSVGSYKGKPLYVRHLTHRSHIQYEDKQSTFEEEALSRGGIREAARLAYLISKGLWSEQKDLEIERQKDTIIRFEDGRKSVAVPSMIDHYNRQIAEERERLGKMLTARAQLLGVTVEVYAQQKLNDHYIITNVFADEGLTQPLVAPEVFEDMADSEVEVLLGAYHKAIDPCGDATLRRLAVQDFFSSYYGMCDDNVSTFYGRPVCELTYYQIRLGTIARHFKALMENVDLSKVDAKTRTDPDAIEKLYTTQKNASAMIAEGKVPANMTQQDITQMGLQKEISYVDKPESAMEIVQRLSRGRRG